MKDASMQFLQKLVEAPSPPGFEQPVQRLVRKEMVTFADKVERDVHGNVIGIKNPNGKPKIMLAGHCDEVGLMIKYISKEGYIYPERAGCPLLYGLMGQRVVIHGRKGSVVGAIVRKRPDAATKAEAEKDLKITDFWIDIGAKDKKGAESVVSIGDPITFAGGFERLQNDMVMARGFDDRIGVFVIVEVMRMLAKKKINASVYGVSTVQEEVGGRGSLTSSFAINPDVGIAIDVWFPSDYPGADKKAVGEMALGKGPALLRGANINPVVGEMLIKTAQQKKIPYQLCGFGFPTPTDASAIQVSRGGVATAYIGVLSRYLHTPVEIISLKDVESSIKLLAAFIEKLNARMDFRPV